MLILIMFFLFQESNGTNWIEYLTFAGVIFNVIALIYLHHLNYKNEYYKKIVEKRFEAYEAIEKALEELGTLSISLPDEQSNLKHYSVFNSWEEYEKFYSNFTTATLKSRWLNKEFYKEYLKLNTFLHDTINPNVGKGNSREIGTKYFKKIDEYRLKITDLLFYDIANLHQLKSFFRRSKKKV